jgi:hypothetical protein
VISERTHRAHERWTLARMLVVDAARALAEDFGSGHARAELTGALKTEQRAHAAFKRAMKAEQQD